MGNKLTGDYMLLNWFLWTCNWC